MKSEPINEEELRKKIPPIKKTQHKYERGYVLGIAGSKAMSGAALLSSFATLRAGAGIVRLFHFDELTSDHPEIIHEKIDTKKILEEAKRAKAVFIGPGLGRTEQAKELVAFLLANLTLPCVIDADALYFLPEKLPSQSILTPHQGEMTRLLNESATLELTQQFVEKRNVTLVLKGMPTFILHPKKIPLMISRGDPGMATAGSGDVLTGIIAALLAQGLESYTAASLGAYLHALAGEIAAKAKTSRSLIASDIIEALPQAYNIVG